MIPGYDDSEGNTVPDEDHVNVVNCQANNTEYLDTYNLRFLLEVKQLH